MSIDKKLHGTRTVREQDQLTAETRVQDWNARVFVGHPCHVTRDDGSSFFTRTRSEAWLLGDRTPVVQVEGISGCYALSRVGLMGK